MQEVSENQKEKGGVRYRKKGASRSERYRYRDQGGGLDPLK